MAPRADKHSAGSSKHRTRGRSLWRPWIVRIQIPTGRPLDITEPRSDPYLVTVGVRSAEFMVTNHIRSRDARIRWARARHSSRQSSHP